MILAHAKLKIAARPYIRQLSRLPGIETNSEDVPLGADEWITAPLAQPHRDLPYRGKLFLTLSVKSDHKVGDALSPEPLIYVPRGTLFVIDPMVVHWLMPLDPARRRKGWIGLQWIVSVDEAAVKGREICTLINGTWVAGDDPRYTEW